LSCPCVLLVDLLRSFNPALPTITEQRSHIARVAYGKSQHTPALRVVQVLAIRGVHEEDVLIGHWSKRSPDNRCLLLRRKSADPIGVSANAPRDRNLPVAPARTTVGLLRRLPDWSEERVVSPV